MTATTRPANTAPATEMFRAVVKRVDRHQAEVLGEMRTGMATLPRGTVPVPGTVVMVRIQGGNWFIEGETLPYQEVSNVPHPTVGGLMGTPVLEASRENAFWVGGRAFYLAPEEAANDVRGWTFVDPGTEAEYVAHLVQGGAPIPSVVLSQATRLRLEELGVDSAALQQLQIGAQILEARQE